MILTTLVVLGEKLPLLSDSESGESMSLIGFIALFNIYELLIK